MAIFRSNYTKLSKIDRLLYLAASNYFLGIGKTTPWDTTWGTDVTEENPPFPEENLTSLPNIVLYKKPFYQTLATESQCGDLGFDNCTVNLGSKKLTLINIGTTSREVIEAVSPEYLYIRVDIEQDDLTFAGVNSFRLAGLFKDMSFTTAGHIRYLPNSVTNSGVLYWASYFTPINKTNIVHKRAIQILLKL